MRSTRRCSRTSACSSGRPRARTSAIARSLPSTDWRCASVGCAVNVGLTSRRDSAVSSSFGSASATSRSTTSCRGPRPSACTAARSSARCSCSARLARWKYVANARPSTAAVPGSSSPSRSRISVSPLSGTSRTSRRTFSTSSSMSSPCWAATVRPSSVESRRMSARSAECSDSEATVPSVETRSARAERCPVSLIDRPPGRRSLLVGPRRWGRRQIVPPIGGADTPRVTPRRRPPGGARGRRGDRGGPRASGTR